MKNFTKKIAIIAAIGFMLIPSTTLFTSCEKECDWYVNDDMGILTGYQDEETCKEWAAKYNDVTCECR